MLLPHLKKKLLRNSYHPNSRYGTSPESERRCRSPNSNQELSTHFNNSSPNPLTPPSVITDVPDAQVRLGSSLDPDSIREGTDVYFDCIVTAHPGVYKVEWKHNVRTPMRLLRLI